MRWLVRVLTKLILWAVSVGGMIIILLDFFATQNLPQTLIKFAILSVIVAVVMRLATRLVDWTYRPPPPKSRRPAPKAPPKPSAVPVSIPKPKPVPEAPQEAHRPQERLFARPPLVEVVQPLTHNVSRSIDARLSRFVDDGERAILEEKK